MPNFQIIFFILYYHEPLLYCSITDQDDVEENIENIRANVITLDKTEDDSNNFQVKPVVDDKKAESQFLEPEEIIDEENQGLFKNQNDEEISWHSLIF